jgi:nitrate reductase assembly molybdenum cofactor insertion protein NarJ
MTAPTLDLLRDAADWRLIGLLFEYPSDDWRTQVAALARETGDPLLTEAAAAALTQATGGIHQSIFGPGGPVPAREATYQSGIQLGYLLAELSSIYQGFGYQPTTPEPPDHIAVEAGFIAFLQLKLACEHACGGPHADTCEQAIAYFLKEHLSTLATPVATGLEAVGPPYLVLAARALLDRTGPPEPRPALPLPGLDDEGPELMCGDPLPGHPDLHVLSDPR